MRFEWIFIEALAVFIENFAFIYFLHNRFISKSDSIKPAVLTWLALSTLGLLTVFLGLPGWLYDISGLGILLAYLLVFKSGRLLNKFFGVAFIEALIVVTTFLGATMASSIIDVNVMHLQAYQDISRLYALIIIKMLQVVVFYSLSKKDINIIDLKKKSSLLFILIIAILLTCLLLLLYGINEYDVNSRQVLLWVTTGLLIVIITIFLLYEIFAREEKNNLDLSAKLQRLEMETHYYKEINAMYSDIRKWRHEYRNNLIALRALVERGEKSEAILYIDNINTRPINDNYLLQTGNLVLDSVVSSKIIYAHTYGIEIEMHAVYPENNNLEDSDLCAIVGNLFDNAIEACQSINNSNHKKFINFSLFAKGKNMTISIANNFEGVLKKEGSNYITSKDKRFHGIGIKYIDSIVDKYHGHVLREHEDNVFETHIIIPLIKPDGES